MKPALAPVFLMLNRPGTEGTEPAAHAQSEAVQEKTAAAENILHGRGCGGGSAPQRNTPGRRFRGQAQKQPEHVLPHRTVPQKGDAS